MTMYNYDDLIENYIKQHNLNWLQILHHPYRTLIISGYGSGKINTLLNLISHQPDIDKIYLCEKDQYEAKYQLLINRSRSIDSNHCNGPKAFIEYANDTYNIYKNIDKYNPNKPKLLTVFDVMVVAMPSKKAYSSSYTIIY